LELKWDAEDTSQATACAEKLTKLLRDRENDDSSPAVTNGDYLSWMTFEVRYRSALESRAQKGTPRRGKSVNLTCAQIL
jgi:hypothetical protein